MSKQDKHKNKNKNQSSEGIKDPKLASAVESNQLSRDEALEAEAKKEKQKADKSQIEKVEGHTPMVFAIEVFYNDPTKAEYEPGKVYQIPNNMVQRWMKRGGQVVDESLDLDLALGKTPAKDAELDLDKDQGENKDIE